jgi:DNA-binding response OmpR family regulator
MLNSASLRFPSLLKVAATVSDSTPLVGPLRVLVADDERDTADTLFRILYHEGHEVQTAYDGAEALQVAREFEPDVVILDIGMPLLNGYDAARALRARHAGVVLVAVTAYKQSTDKIFAKMAGFDQHFGKPCDPNAIVDLLASIKRNR